MDPLLLGLTVTAFIFIETDIGCDLETVVESLTPLAEVQEIHHVIGEWCFLLKVRTDSPQALEELIHQKLRKNLNIRRTFTTLATSSAYETPKLPLPAIRRSGATVE